MDPDYDVSWFGFCVSDVRHLTADRFQTWCHANRLATASFCTGWCTPAPCPCPRVVLWLSARRTNIPGGDKSTLSAGTTVASYVPPLPPRNTGDHRYVFVLAMQEARVEPAWPKPTLGSLAGRGAWQGFAAAGTLTHTRARHSRVQHGAVPERAQAEPQGSGLLPGRV
jgi:phosphatidylethanolamine-binding protein (PEBP) family uncharacterized protein